MMTQSDLTKHNHMSRASRLSSCGFMIVTASCIDNSVVDKIGLVAIVTNCEWSLVICVGASRTRNDDC